VAFTAPASNGGATITSYTATSSPSGITGTLSQAGSGTITVSGLAGGTSYTFTVTATNSAGTSAASSASNSITTTPVIGQAYAGGFFAGQISTSGNGIANFNIVVGPVASAQAGNIRWKTTDTDTAGTSSVIDGPTNSANMNNASHPSAQFCEGLSIGGFTDWYMPAKNELEICYYNLKPGTGANENTAGANPNAVPARANNYGVFPTQTTATAFRTGGTEAFGGNPSYWSSTQNPSNVYKGRCQYFSDGNQIARYKTGQYNVRGIRRVAV
jgi:hypothetical protein